ncbi:Multidrug resistance protein YkkC [compost metagenome]
MNKTWLSVVIAALFEVAWVIGLKHASGWLEWGGTLVAIFVSFILMIWTKACRLNNDGI